MERENTWGYTRIRGALRNLGHEIGRNTIKRILQEHGIDPAPERGRRMSWATFIKAHLGAIVGMDFFTVEAVTWLGLVRYHVLFAIDIASRNVEILGIAVNPGGPWMEQVARNLVDALDGFLLGKRYLLLDRDPLYTQAFRQILDRAGIKTVRLSAHSPNLNAFAERFVLSIKSGNNRLERRHDDRVKCGPDRPESPGFPGHIENSDRARRDRFTDLPADRLHT
jgi:transposase InsO family protein